MSVVATDVGNVASVLAGSGVLARPKDPAHLAEALLSLLQGPHAVELRDRLSAAALDRARRHYTADVCTRKFGELYSELILCEPICPTA